MRQRGPRKPAATTCSSFHDPYSKTRGFGSAISGEKCARSWSLMIRAATIADLEVLVEGNRAMARETEALELDDGILRSGVRAILEGRQPGMYRVLEEDGRVLAQLMVTFEWSDWRNRVVWWIQSVYVWPAARRRGGFRELYRALVEEARATGAGGVRLYVDERNARAQDTYRALGMDGGHYRVFEHMWT